MARILCLDDDRTALSLKQRSLEAAGHTVETSYSVAEALKKLDSAAFDAIVTDWWIAENDALRVVQSAKHTKGIPVIVVSGFISDALVALGTAADLYLEKPVRVVDLQTAIEELLPRSNEES